MRIKKVTDADAFPEINYIDITQGFISHSPKSFISLAVYFYDAEDRKDAHKDLTCSLSVSFITPVSADDKQVDSMFTLHNILSGRTVNEVVLNFIGGYGKFGFFNNCDLGDEVFVSYVDGTTSNDFYVSKIIEESKKNNAFDELLGNLPQFNKDVKSPRLVK